MTRGLGLAWIILGCASTASAQEAVTRVGFGFGVFADYPADFVGRGCDGRQGGFTARVGRSVTSVLTLDLGVTWTGDVAATECVTARLSSRPAPPDGTPYTSHELGESIDGVTFFSSHFAALVEPWEIGRHAPRLRLSAGRIWDKELWTWTYGAGWRYSLGSHGVVLDVERWNISYDVREQTWIFREQSADDLVTDRILTRRPRPWLIRLSWEMRVG